jgi:hypothetical protein
MALTIVAVAADSNRMDLFGQRQIEQAVTLVFAVVEHDTCVAKHLVVPEPVAIVVKRSFVCVESAVRMLALR